MGRFTITCRPELPPVPLLARTSGPSNPDTELGPTYTHLHLHNLVGCSWHAVFWSPQFPFPVQVGESPLGSAPGLAPSPGSRMRPNTPRTPTSIPAVFLCPLCQRAELRPTALSHRSSLTVAPGRGAAPLPYPGPKLGQPQGSIGGSRVGAAAPCRALVGPNLSCFSTAPQWNKAAGTLTNTTPGLPHSWVTQQPCLRGLEYPGYSGEQDLGTGMVGKVNAFFLAGIDKQALTG